MINKATIVLRLYIHIDLTFTGGGVADGKGDGATSDENIKVGSTHVRYYDKNQCDAK